MRASQTRTRSQTSRRLMPALCCLMCLPALPVHAQEEESADGQDPTIVVTRTVHPRIAYRGIPREDHPVASEATTFPARVFGDAIDVLIGSVVGDGELGQQGAAGPMAGMLVPLLDRSTAPLGPTVTGAVGGAPLGMSATTGAIGGATRNLGSVISGALAPPISAGQPGGGP